MGGSGMIFLGRRRCIFSSPFRMYLVRRCRRNSVKLMSPRRDQSFMSMLPKRLKKGSQEAEFAHL
jgi:hypothetical protein